MGSALREITRVALEGTVKLVLSGTGLSLEEVESALASGVSKTSVKDFRLIHDLGAFDNWTILEPFIRRYVPGFVLDTRSGYHLQYRIRQYLLGRPANLFSFYRWLAEIFCRHRFVTSFLECFIRNGFQSPHKIFDEYVKEHTTRLPGDHVRVELEPPLLIQIELLSFDWGRLQQGKKKATAVAITLTSFCRSTNP